MTVPLSLKSGGTYLPNPPDGYATARISSAIYNGSWQLTTDS